MQLSKTKSLIALHIIIFIWGFTGILGELIEMSSIPLVFNRMFIAFLILIIFQFLFFKTKKISKKNKIFFLGTGVLIAIHWIFFFESIKVSNVSLGVTCLSTTAFFTSIIDPIFKKKKIKLYEIFLSFFVIIGILIIFIADEEVMSKSEKEKGILLSILSAIFASIFTSINSIFIEKGNSSFQITKYEMIGGSIFTFLYLLIQNEVNEKVIPKGNDIYFILLLSIICTALAYLISVEIMKKIKPFTMNISVNMEPIYAVILAIIIFKDQEIMSSSFYLGAIIIIISILLNTIFKKHLNK